MRLSSVRMILLGVAVCSGAGSLVRGQVVDSPGGAVQMVPGGAVGKGSVPDAKVSADAAVPGKVTYVPPSEDEQLSRHLLQLKSERAALASKAGAGDSQVAEVDEKIAQAQAELAGKVLSNGDAGPAEAADVALMYPRIVPASEDMPVLQTQVMAAPMASGPVDVRAQTGMMRDNAANRAVLGKVEENFRSLEADGEGLSKVLDRIATESHVNMFVNWTALQTMNVDRNTPVTLMVHDVPVRRALTLVLAQVGGQTANLGYCVDDGVLTVSTREDLQSAKYQIVEVYNVSDLINRPLRNYAAVLGPQVYAAQAELVMDTIKAAVAPDTWRDSGGTIGSIREFNGCLIINQTADNHREIERLLAKLRAQ